MSLTVVALAVAAATTTPAVRSFWKLEEVPRPQPVQTRVSAELVREGRFLVVYREKGYRFSTLGEADEERQIAAATETFDTVIYPRLVELFGPCPDLDGNGRVILLLTRSTRDETTFLGFDTMPDGEAARFGMHSNEGELLYLSFSQQGNHAPGNTAALAASFHRLLHWARDPAEVAWSELLAGYSAYLCDLTGPRALWGDAGHLLPSPSPADPWTAHGWPLLFLEYARERAGVGLLRELAASRETGVAGLEASLAAARPPLSFADLAADFAMACWLDDGAISGGHFAFPSLSPPRPPLMARFVASRPASGQLSSGVGGVVHLLVQGDGERPLPLVLRGDPAIHWLGRAVHLRRLGPDEELPLAFDDGGLARLELPLLPTGDGVIIAVMPRPPATADFDPRRLALFWGLGWVPRPWADPISESIQALLGAGAGGEASPTVRRIGETLDRLGGLAPPRDGAALQTRYAWSPAAAAVIPLLQQEAEARGLQAHPLAFIRTAPPDLRQEWQDLLLELPGGDARRWPVVIAAHWDAARTSLPESYQRALALDDNASGVVVALEAAATLARTQRRVPVVVALLAGGHHGAAGAAALLERLDSRIAAWVELDGVGRPAPHPSQLSVHVEGGAERDATTVAVVAALRRAGLKPVVVKELASPHSGAALAQARGISAVVLRTRAADAAGADADVPVLVERGMVSPELIAVLSQAVGRAVAALTGVPQAGD